MKRVYSIVLFFLILIPVLYPPVAHAATDTNWVDGNNGGDSWYATEMYRSRTTGDVSLRPHAVTMFDVPFYRIIELILGGISTMIVPKNVMQTDPKYVQELNQKSAVAGIGNYIAMIYANPPADTRLFLADISRSLGFTPPQAYAQGVGFSGLASLLPIWKAFRNIAYLLLAIVMIVIGFMVMLRKKIDPKTVVTVQNALPRIVVTLLLITFSYAIVGVMVDIMYLVMAFIITILVSASNGVLGADTMTKYLNGGFWNLFGSLFGGGLSAFDDVIRLISFDGGYGFWGTISQTGTTLVFGLFIGVILALAILFGFVRILFMLLTSYIQIIISLLVSPLQLLFDALPGGTSFTSWFNNLLSNLAVFPITAGMLLIGTILTRLDPAFPGFQGGGGKLWTPPLLSASGASGIPGLIGLGVLLTIPTVAAGIKEALKAKPPISAGPGAIVGPIGAGVGQVMQLGYQLSFVTQAIKGHGPAPKTDVETFKEKAKA